MTFADFTTEHPAESAWIVATAPRFDFANAMLTAVERWGDLTANQMAAVRKCMARDAERAASRQGTDIDTSALEAAFKVARDQKAKKAYLRTGAVVFSLAKEHSANPGAIYAKDADGEYLGKIVGGKFHGSFACTPAHRADVVEASRDPLAAALRYAKDTNRCSVCGVLLTDPASKARGIGPVCASKFGW